MVLKHPGSTPIFTATTFGTPSPGSLPGDRLDVNNIVAVVRLQVA
jgi:hypothetical protein